MLGAYPSGYLATIQAASVDGGGLGIRAWFRLHERKPLLGLPHDVPGFGSLTACSLPRRQGGSALTLQPSNFVPSFVKPILSLLTRRPHAPFIDSERPLSAPCEASLASPPSSAHPRLSELAAGQHALRGERDEPPGGQERCDERPVEGAARHGEWVPLGRTGHDRDQQPRGTGECWSLSSRQGCCLLMRGQPPVDPRPASSCAVRTLQVNRWFTGTLRSRVQQRLSAMCQGVDRGVKFVLMVGCVAVGMRLYAAATRFVGRSP